MGIKKIILALFFIGIIAVSISSVNAGEKVTVKETTFELPDDAKITQAQDDLVSFEASEGMKGFIGYIDHEELLSFTKNDTDYYVESMNNTGPQTYFFMDKSMQIWGDLMTFNENGHNFIFEVYYNETVDPSSSEDKMNMTLQEIIDFYDKNPTMQAVYST